MRNRAPLVSPALHPAPVSRFFPAGGRKNADARISSRESHASLAALQDLQRPLSLLPAETIPEALGCIEALRAALWLRMNSPGNPTPETGEDRLLDVREAAQRLGCSVGTLYKRADDYPFTVRLSAGRVQFSSKGVDEYIRSFQSR